MCNDKKCAICEGDSECLCMYVCMYVCKHVCMHAYENIKMCVLNYLNFVCLYVCMYVCVYVRIREHQSMCNDLFVQTHAYIHTYTHACIHTYTPTSELREFFMYPLCMYVCMHAYENI